MINAIYEESQQRAAELGQQTAEDLLAARLQFYEDERVRCKMKRPSRLSEHDYIKDCLAAFHAGATFGSTQAREWECWWRTAHANIDHERYVLSILDYYSKRFEEHRTNSGRENFRQEMSNAEFDAIKSVLLKQSARIDHLLQELCDLQSGAASTTYVADSRRFWWIVRSLLKRDDKASARHRNHLFSRAIGQAREELDYRHEPSDFERCVGTALSRLIDNAMAREPLPHYERHCYATSG